MLFDSRVQTIVSFTLRFIFILELELCCIMQHDPWSIYDKLTIYGHFKTPSKCSIELAKTDLQSMEVYRENITTAATNKG